MIKCSHQKIIASLSWPPFALSRCDWVHPNCRLGFYLFNCLAVIQAMLCASKVKGPLKWLVTPLDIRSLVEKACCNLVQVGDDGRRVPVTLGTGVAKTVGFVSHALSQKLTKIHYRRQLRLKSGLLAYLEQVWRLAAWADLLQLLQMSRSSLLKHWLKQRRHCWKHWSTVYILPPISPPQ